MSYLPPLYDGRQQHPQQFAGSYPPVPHFYLYPHHQTSYYPMYAQPMYPQPIPRGYEEPHYPRYEIGGGAGQPQGGAGGPEAEQDGAPAGMGGGPGRPGPQSTSLGGRPLDYDVRVPLHKRLLNRYDRVVAWFYRTMMIRHRNLLGYLKFACSTISITTVFICYAIGMILRHPFSEFTFPYLSYTGAEYPEKLFFMTGLTLSSVMFFPVLLVNQAGLIYVRGGTRGLRTLANLGLLSGIASGIFLSLLTIFDTERHKTVHYAFALSFFACSFIWALTEASAHFLWFRNEPKNYYLKKAIVMKYVVIVFLFAVFIAFLTATSDRACNFMMNMSEFSECPGSQTTGAITQYMLLSLIMLYIGTLSFKKYEDSVLARDYDPYKLKGTPSFTELLTSFRDSEERPSSRPSTVRNNSTVASLGGGAGGAGGAGGMEEPEPVAPSRKSLERPRKSIDSGKASIEMDVDDLPSVPPPAASGLPPSVPNPSTSSGRGLTFPSQPFIEAIPEEPGRQPATSSLRLHGKSLGTTRSARSVLPSPDVEVSGAPEEGASLQDRMKGGSGRRKFSLTPEVSRSSIDISSDAPRPQMSQNFKSVMDLRGSEPSAPPVPRENLYEMQERLAKRRPSVDNRRGGGYENPYPTAPMPGGSHLDPSVFQSRPF